MRVVGRGLQTTCRGAGLKDFGESSESHGSLGTSQLGCALIGGYASLMHIHCSMTSNPSSICQLFTASQPITTESLSIATTSPPYGFCSSASLLPKTAIISVPQYLLYTLS